MKKVCLLVFVLVILLNGQVFAGEKSPANIELNGIKVQAGELEPYIEEGITMVPLRWIAENLGKNVTWDSATYTAGINTNLEKISGEFGVGNKDNVIVVIEGRPLYEDTDRVSVIIEGSTFVPLRPISDALDINISWDAENSKVIMSTESTNEITSLDAFRMADRIKEFDIIVDGNAYSMENVIKDPSVLEGTSAEVIKDGFVFGSKTFYVSSVTNIGSVNNEYQDLETLFDDVWTLPEDVRYVVGNSEDGYAAFFEPRAEIFGWHYKE